MPSAASPTDSHRASGIPGLGQVFTLSTPIVNGRGRLDVYGIVWLVSGPDLPRGAPVRVIGVDGPRLRVEPA